MTVADERTGADTSGGHAALKDIRSRLIDRWFPCAAVDAAVGTPAGSGRSEKALFTWFASRPIAQARAAILTTLLPDRPDLHADVRAAVETGNGATLERLRHAVSDQYPEGHPVVLDIFSGRGIIPLEAARLGVTAVGTDLSLWVPKTSSRSWEQAIFVYQASDASVSSDAVPLKIGRLG